MPVLFMACPSCRTPIETSEAFADMLMRCPKCSTVFQAPDQQTIAAAHAANQASAPPPRQKDPALFADYVPMDPPQYQVPGTPPPNARPTMPTRIGSSLIGNAPPPNPRPVAPPPVPPPPPPAMTPGEVLRNFFRMTSRSLRDRAYDLHRPHAFDPAMMSADETRGEYRAERKSLEERASALGMSREKTEKLLDAFDRLARSAVSLAERNDYRGQKEEEIAQRKHERETEIARKKEEQERKQQQEDRRASWQRMTGKSGVADTLFGADRLERDPRGYLMSVMGLMTSGPVMSRLRSLVSGTINGAASGYQAAGLAGAAAGAAVGASSDIFNLGRSANPQAANTFDQSWELLKTRIGTSTGADYWMNAAAAGLQGLSDSAKSSGTRSFSRDASAYAAEAPPGLVAANLGLVPLYGAGRAAYARMTGEKPKAPVMPDMMAPPTIDGVGRAAGTASYEGYALSFGMSSLNTSPIDQQRILEQLQNMNMRMERLTDNSENLRNITPAFR